MAGNYPDAPSNRMALDVDGTAFAKADASNVITSFTNADAQKVNNENDDLVYFVGNWTWGRFIAIFPELRDISGLFIQTLYTDAVGGGSWQDPAVQWSADTTNGLDGTWTTVVGVANGHFNNTGAVSPRYRNNISAVALSGVKGLRVNVNSGVYNGTGMQAFHVYGRISAGQNPNRLELWHPTLDQRIGYGSVDAANKGFDWGNAARSSAADATFRVKNRSATLTANSVTVSVEALTDGSPSFVNAHYLSDDGTSFGSNVVVPSIGPGGISPVLTLRRSLSATAVLGLAAARVKAVASSWT